MCLNLEIFLSFKVDEIIYFMTFNPMLLQVSIDEMLSLACRQGKQDIVELLLESGASVNHRNSTG